MMIPKNIEIVGIVFLLLLDDHRPSDSQPFNANLQFSVYFVKSLFQEGVTNGVAMKNFKP